MAELCRLTHANKLEAVSVLVSAFFDYPVMRYILKNAAGEYEHRLNAVLSFYCEARFAKDRPVLGIREDELLVAVALIDQTSLQPWAFLPQELDRLRVVIGDEAYSRLELYETITGAAEPTFPHFFLGMIGVRKEHHGKGYARILLDEVKKMSSADPASDGICLTTEDIENVRLYEHFGFRIISESDIEELHSWCLFLPT